MEKLLANLLRDHVSNPDEIDPIEEFRYAWKNNGQMKNPLKGKNDKIALADALTYADAPMFLGKMVEETIQETIEPLMIITSLMERIPFVQGMVLGGRVLGAIGEDFDVGEEEAFPEVRIQMGPGSARAVAPRKSGCIIRFTQEQLRYQDFGFVESHIREVARALARAKETKALRLFKSIGRVTHDNANPSNSVFGVTTGRGFTGAANGSLHPDNLLECMTQLWNNGFNADTMFIHPLTYLMFLKDPVLRNFVNNNNSRTYFLSYTGNPAMPGPFAGDPRGITNTRQITGFNATNGEKAPASAYHPWQQTAPVLPGYFGFPLNIVVSPVMDIDIPNSLCDIIVADSSQLGYYVVDEEVTETRWEVPDQEIYKIKFRERYSFEVKNAGNGVAIMKNVAIKSNEILLPAQAHITVADSDLSEIGRNTALFGG